VSNEEFTSLLIEQNYCDELVQFLKDYVDNVLPRQLTYVESSAQRRILEGLGRAYSDQAPSPYFGVIAEYDSQDDTPKGITRIGKRVLHDNDSNELVVGWESDIGRQFAQLERLQNEDIRGATVVIREGSVNDIAFSNSGKAIRRRDRIGEARTGVLDDIIDVIMPEQDDIVRLDHKGPLVIEGGPGTGKTVVALQRIAFLMLAHQKRILDSLNILVVGPTKAYLKYVELFLPRLGLGPVISEDFLSICLRVLSTQERTEFNNLRIEQDNIRISKNSLKLIRVVSESLWPKIEVSSIAARVYLSIGLPVLRHIDGREIDTILLALKVNYERGELSYEQCRNSLESELQKLLLTDSPQSSVRDGGTSIARRNRIIDLWVNKIGIYSQEKRSNAQIKIASPTGGRLKRDLLSVVNRYYQVDIENAIDEIAESGTFEVSVLLDSLTRRQARTKLSNSVETDLDKSTEIVIDFGDISFGEVQNTRSGIGLPQVLQVVNQWLPKRDVLTHARKICSGDKKIFESVLGDEGAALAARFAAVKDSKDSGRKYLWSDADIPVVAEVDYWINGLSNYSKFINVLVDEAQDLTRLQSRAISRFAVSRNITLVGDQNQATRSGYLGSWESIMEAMGLWGESIRLNDSDVHISRLLHNYRVPENIYDYARLYLKEEDRINTPSSDVSGGDVTLLDYINDNFDVEVPRLLAKKAALGARVAVVTQDKFVIKKIEELNLLNVIILSPEESKGLEVDHLILFQPSQWFSGTGRSKNLMYVVLTRATKSVTILQKNPTAYNIHIPVEY
jgi:DNA helicase IV